MFPRVLVTPINNNSPSIMEKTSVGPYKNTDEKEKEQKQKNSVMI